MALPAVGVELNPQRHVNAVWGVGDGARSFVGWVAEHADVDPGAVLAADLMTHDLTPSTLVGAHRELVSAPRLDNQGTCYAGLEAFLAADPGDYVPVLALFDHEEVGSTSDHGAQSELLLTVLERIVLAAGGTITHHHAVGRDHRASYERQRPEPFARALRAAKGAPDPDWPRNPGVLLHSVQ